MTEVTHCAADATRNSFRRQHPELFFLDAGDLPSLAGYLRRRNCLPPNDEVLSAAPAGAGNMNCTLRVKTSHGSLVVKQARPWVEKYPQIAAPWDRALLEAEFYRTIQADHAIAADMPELIGFDADARVLILEDFGTSLDFTSMYQNAGVSLAEVDALTDFLIHLHHRFSGAALAARFSSIEMRKLNHEHIFDFPLRPDNGLDLDKITPGLSALAGSLQSDGGYADRVAALGVLYLGGGRTLIHGDYFPGSWLRTPSGVRIIDPEFCFFGLPEIELGVMIAHFHLARCPAALAERVLERYAAKAALEPGLALAFAGVEIMRRLIGVAQLPLPYGVGEKRSLLNLSHSLVMNR